MAALLASSSANNDENQLEPVKYVRENIKTLDSSPVDSSRIHSRLLHRRIFTMLDSLRRPNDDSHSLSANSHHDESTSQPITFGQLRHITASPILIRTVQDQPPSSSQLPINTISINAGENHSKSVRSPPTDLTSSVSRITATSIEKPLLPERSTTLEPLPLSPSLGQQVGIPGRTDQVEPWPTASLTVDQILTFYHSKSTALSSSDSHTAGAHPTQAFPSHASSVTNHRSPIRWPFDEPMNPRPPPPYYTSIVANNYRSNSASVYRTGVYCTNDFLGDLAAL